jgi:hypothetical protein
MQTLHALGALVIVMLLALSVQRSLIRGDGRMMLNESESIALAAATDVLDHAGTLRFDARPNTVVAAQLTPAGGFGMPNATLRTAVDIDDLHALLDTVRVTAPGGEMRLARTVTVRYMERAGAAYVPASSQTFVKEVTVEVRGPVGAMARLTRLYGHRPGIRA